MLQLVKEIRESFSERCVEKETGCVEWQGAKIPDGYGVMRFLGKHILAHRFSFLLHGGEIPEGKYLCHRCDNPACVNPAHLFVGTQTDNMQDAMKKGRHRPPPLGENHHRAKLTEEKVRLIRKMRAEGVSQQKIAEFIGTPQTNISAILRGRTWKEVK
jgi:hypothetical protein